ncbi:MAG: hypothetical protein COC01_01450 [Bacteroidetes bacterium]|nr:MAG: hypothetical protein COC01_01450 [Bacteroidota bacterium]
MNCTEIKLVKSTWYVPLLLVSLVLTSCVTKRTFVSQAYNNERAIIAGCMLLFMDPDKKLEFKSKEIQKVLMQKLKIDSFSINRKDSSVTITNNGSIMLHSIHYLKVSIATKMKMAEISKTDSIYEHAERITNRIVYSVNSHY